MKIFKETHKEKTLLDIPDKKKTVIVEVRMDHHSPELLTWTLINAALPGDQIIALHVADANTLLSAINELHSVVAVYEGFCNLKQIDLKLKVIRGFSIRKVLVSEARSFAAAAVILGSSMISIAKFCAKKLPVDCSVLVVNNGKIIFQRHAFPLPKSLILDSDHNKIKAEVPRKQNCSLCACSSVSGSSPPVKKEPLAMREARPGWPLLRRLFLTNKKNSCSIDRTKTSMVRWAMRLPKHMNSLSNTTPISDGDSSSIGPMETESSHPSVSNHEEGEKIPKELEYLLEKCTPACRLFSYQELVDATSKFSPDRIVGNGGSGCVYKGCLSDGKELAIKMLKPSEDARQEFVSEVEIMTALRHKNIVSLLGFCFDKDNHILVYEFLSRGSLEEILHGDKEIENVLSWTERYKIAVGVAEALDYLHCSGNSQPVIHGDVKSSNILLSDDLEPQLCDFGLARWASTSSTHVTCTDIAGTFGYLAPEYFMYGKVNEKVDVYSFGVVLLELISGKKPVSTRCLKSRESVVVWAKPILQGGKLKQLVDPILGGEYDNNQMEWMALAASLCIRRAAQSRPCIALVLKVLQGRGDALMWARSEIGGGSDAFSGWDDETSCADSDIQSHINLALLDLEDEETTSMCSSVDFITSNTSLEEYLQSRWMR